MLRADDAPEALQLSRTYGATWWQWDMFSGEYCMVYVRRGRAVLSSGEEEKKDSGTMRRMEGWRGKRGGGGAGE
jgi:hypothetical protein